MTSDSNEFNSSNDSIYIFRTKKNTRKTWTILVVLSVIILFLEFGLRFYQKFKAGYGLKRFLGSMTDTRDGQVYKTVKIGKQVWLAENMRATYYSDGSKIPLITNDSQWVEVGKDISNKAYCWYDNDSSSYANTFGALYNYAAAINYKDSIQKGPTIQGICPSGWHVPTYKEWVELLNTIGGDKGFAGGKLKSKDGWDLPNKRATNISGFSALPAGVRMTHFVGKGYTTCYIIADSYTRNQELEGIALVNSTDAVLNRRDPISSGLSVRCIKDQ